jgi:hypothetical protein
MRGRIGGKRLLVHQRRQGFEARAHAASNLGNDAIEERA